MLKNLKRLKIERVLLTVLLLIILAEIIFIIGVLFLYTPNDNIKNERIDLEMARDIAISIEKEGKTVQIEEKGETIYVLSDGKYYIKDRSLYKNENNELVQKYYDLNNPYYPYIYALKGFTITYNNTNNKIYMEKYGKTISYVSQHGDLDVYPKSNTLVIYNGKVADIYIIKTEIKNKNIEFDIKSIYTEIYNGELSSYEISEKPITVKEFEID